jgi:hypothetical protein
MGLSPLMSAVFGTFPVDVGCVNGTFPVDIGCVAVTRLLASITPGSRPQPPGLPGVKTPADGAAYRGTSLTRNRPP